MHPLAAWLEQTPFSIALRESLFIYPVLATVHVVSIIWFVGLIAILDLRLLNAVLTDRDVLQISSKIKPWALAGFIVLMLSGAILLAANPPRLYLSFWFRLKFLLILLGAVNAFWFHFRAGADLFKSARGTGAISLILWLGVIFLSRMIAFDWFACGRTMPDWIAWFSGCS